MRSILSMAWACPAILLVAACDGTVPPPGRAPTGGGGAGGADAGAQSDAGPLACGPRVTAAFCLTDPPFAAAWSGAVDDVWILESDFQEVTARRFDGRGWTTFDAGANALSGVWGSGPRDVWAVGAAGAVVHFDGAAWSPFAAADAAGADLTAIWGSGSDDVWAVGTSTGAAVTLHWDGAAWSAIDCCGPATAAGIDLRAVAGSGPTDVWAVGSATDATTGATSPAALHWDGSTWRSAAVPGSGFGLTSVWSDGTGDVWFGGPQEILRATGGAFSSTTIVGTVTALWGSGPDDVWATTKAGGTLRFDGAAWTTIASGTTNPLVAIAGSGPADLWAVGTAGTILHGNGATWTPLTDGTTGPLGAVWADGADDIWTSGPLRFQNGGWSHDAGGASISASGLCGFSDDDVWAVGATLAAGDGNGFIAHWDGGAWTIDGIADIYSPTRTAAPNLGPSSMNAVWCDTPTDIWAVGQISVITGPVADTIAHFDGQVWSPLVTPTTAFLSGVWGSAADDVWAAGASGTLFHWNGAAWTAAASGTSDDLGAVWGSGPDDVWVAVARKPQFLHWDGSAWRPVASGGSAGLTALWGSGPGDVWAVGGDASSGEVLHFGGQFWSTVWNAPTAVGKLTGVWGTADGALAVGAANGMIFTRPASALP